MKTVLLSIIAASFLSVAHAGPAIKPLLLPEAKQELIEAYPVLKASDELTQGFVGACLQILQMKGESQGRYHDLRRCLTIHKQM